VVSSGPLAPHRLLAWGKGTNEQADSSAWWFAWTCGTLLTWAADVAGNFTLGAYWASLKEGLTLIVAVLSCILLL
jgi:hypothetical protein